MNPLGENRPRSVDLDGSQPAVPKTNLFSFPENLPDTAENHTFEPQAFSHGVFESISIKGTSNKIGKHRPIRFDSGKSAWAPAHPGG